MQFIIAMEEHGSALVKLKHPPGGFVQVADVRKASNELHVKEA